MSEIQNRLDAMPEAEIRLRLGVLIEQCEKEDASWLAFDKLRGTATEPGRPSSAYLATREIYHLLGLDGAVKPGVVELCSRCKHPVILHDSEGCTITIPCSDPDFGDTETCPCCQKGPRR